MVIDLGPHERELNVENIPLLVKKILHSFNTTGQVVLRSSDGSFDFYLNGLCEVLESICYNFNVPFDAITFITNNPFFPGSDKFLTIQIDSDATPHKVGNFPIGLRQWDKTKIFGLLIGRLSSSKIIAAYKYKQFEFRDYGLYACHSNPLDINQLILGNFFDLYHGVTTTQIYTDIKKESNFTTVTDDCLKFNGTESKLDFAFQENFYQKILFEISPETCASSHYSALSEKTLRPMMYRRIPLVISASGANKRWANYYGFDFFEDITGDYDSDLVPMERVNKIYDFLSSVIRHNEADDIWESVQSRLDYNYNLFINHWKRQAAHKSLHTIHKPLW